MNISQFDGCCGPQLKTDRNAAEMKNKIPGHVIRVQRGGGTVPTYFSSNYIGFFFSLKHKFATIAKTRLLLFCY